MWPRNLERSSPHHFWSCWLCPWEDYTSHPGNTWSELRHGSSNHVIRCSFSCLKFSAVFGLLSAPVHELPPATVQSAHRHPTSLCQFSKKMGQHQLCLCLSTNPIEHTFIQQGDDLPVAQNHVLTKLIDHFADIPPLDWGSSSTMRSSPMNTMNTTPEVWVRYLSIRFQKPS